MKRIKILSVVSKLYFGGHENRLLSLARCIDRNRFEHAVVTISAEPHEGGEGTMRPYFRAAGIDVRDLGEFHLEPAAGKYRPAHLLRNAACLPRTVRKLVRLVRENEIDVIDTHHTFAMVASVLAARITGVKSLLTAYHTQPWDRAAVWPVAQATFGLADLIVTDSEARRNDLKQFIRARTPIEVIQNGIEPPAATRSPAEVRKELGLPADPRVRIVAQIGGIVPSKGGAVLVEAARHVLQRHPAVVFLLLGYHRGFAEFERQLKSRVRELGLEGRIIIAGYPGPIGDVWNIVDVHVHASLFDSLPNAIIEGMSLGKPAVVTSVGGIPEVVEHEATGLVVPPNDAAALAGGLERMLNSPEEASRFAAAAQARYQERLRPQVMAERLEREFERLVIGAGLENQTAALRRRAA